MIRIRLIILFLYILVSAAAFSQCLSVHLPLEERVANSPHIVSGRVVSQHAYEDEKGNIYTLNVLAVNAYLKGNSQREKVGIITPGGAVGNKMQITTPALKMKFGNEYVVFLERDNRRIDADAIRSSEPGMPQCLAYGDMQGALLYQQGKYYDGRGTDFFNEVNLFNRISQLTGQPAYKPDGQIYIPRIFTDPTISTTVISEMYPLESKGGTIDPLDFLHIRGAGFGTVPGFIYFTNADDGGATFTASGVESDIVQWTDTLIIVKVPDNAGTGLINVDGLVMSDSILTVSYSHIAVNSIASGFPEVTRQRYYLRNMDMTGGYIFRLNSTSGFSTNTVAVDALRRAIETWDCTTFINLELGTPTTADYADDNESVVMFDATLPAGILATATNRFTGGSSGICNLSNTVWVLKEADIQIKPDPPISAKPWQYGPLLPGASQYDLESALLHELGHVHGLSHSMGIGEVMYYDLQPGTSNRTPSANEILGGMDKLSYSTTPTCMDPAGTEMVPLDGSSCSVVLPTELLVFNATKQDKVVALSWATVSETNNDYYIIEKSTDAIHYSQAGKVEGAGNSNSLLNYALTDEFPFPGVSYYRLKQYDFDGTFKYSNIIEVDFGNVPFDELQIVPNPSTDKIKIAFQSPSQTPVNIMIFEASGRSVYTKKFPLTELDTNPEIDIRHLSNGMYFIEISGNGSNFKRKFLKN